jgi:molybdopterin-containing oxidoreductase family iron-sulfur binding subunit
VAEWRFVATLSPSDAPPGVADGDRIRVESPHGAVELPVRLDPRMHPGCLAIPTGGGHRALGRWAQGFGVNVMELLAPTPAPDTGASMLCATRVRIARAGRG